MSLDPNARLIAAFDEMIAYLKNSARDLQSLKSQVGEVITYMNEAESEVPEKMRRFMMYMHDAHETAIFYERGGQPMPQYLVKELQRCDDRYRQLLEDMHLDNGAFERVRQDMTKRGGNRWDHSRLLPKESVS